MKKSPYLPYGDSYHEPSAAGCFSVALVAALSLAAIAYRLFIQ